MRASLFDVIGMDVQPEFDATGTFIGLTPRTTKGHLTRAVIEGVCYSLRECIEIFRAMNVPVSEARVTGGGSYSFTYLGIPGAPKGVYTQVG